MKQIHLNRTTSLTQTTSTRYTAPFSDNTSWASSARTAKMAAAGNLGYLRVERRATGNGALSVLGAGITETYQILINGSGVSGAVGGTVTIGPGESDGLAQGLDMPVAVGDLVTISRTVTGGNPATYIPCISLVFSTTSKNTSIYGGFASPSSSATSYIAPLLASSTTSTRVSERGSCHVGGFGSITYHTFEVDVAPGGGKSISYYLYLNGVKQDGTGGTVDTHVTISNSATTGSASFDLPVVPGDELSLQIVPSGSPASSTLSYGCRFVATALTIDLDGGGAILIDDNIYQMCINHTNPSGTNASFIAPNSVACGPWEGLGSCGVTGKALDETPDPGSAFWFQVGMIHVSTATAPGADTARRWYLRNNGVSVPGARMDIIASETFETLNLDDVVAEVYVHGKVFSIRELEDDTTTGDVDNDGNPPASALTMMGLVAFTGHNYLPTVGGTITSITPNNGTQAGGTAFTIAGTDFLTDADNVRVLLRGVEATSVVVNSSTEIVGVSGASASAGLGDVEVLFEYDDPLVVDGDTSLADGWTYNSSSQWFAFDPTVTDPADPNSGLDPNTPTTNGPIYFFGTEPPGGVGWVTSTAPSVNGWWWSDEGMAGAPNVVDDSDKPMPPRTWNEISSFATGAAAHLGGNCAVAFRNKMIYAARGYTVDTDDPPLRIFDGQSDRLIVRVPKDSSGNEAQAVMCMIVADGTIYLSTLDVSGNGGRVFKFDLDTATFTQMGAAYSGGEVPYALCWGMGRLWIGTNFGDGSPGRVLFIRPGIDAAATEDEQFGAALGGVQDLTFYNGKLYAAIDNEAGTTGEVRVRSTAGAWSQSVAGTDTEAMNGYTRLLVFNNLLFAAYWDDDASAKVSIIKKYDDTSWSTVYTGSGRTLIPCIALFAHRGNIYALFGGDGRDPALIYSATGASSSWTDLTSVVFASDDAEATPAIASVRF